MKFRYDYNGRGLAVMMDGGVVSEGGLSKAKKKKKKLQRISRRMNRKKK